MARHVERGDNGRLWNDELVPIERERSGYHVSPGYLPEIRHLNMDQPLVWLRKGWQDLRRHPGIAIGYGAIITAIYAAIVILALATRYYHVGIQLTAGFILMAPLSALGFYGISRREEEGRRVAFRHTFEAWRRNPNGVLGLGVILVLLFLAWFMVSMQTAAFLVESKAVLLFSWGGGTFSEFATELVTNLTIPMVLAYFGIGLAAVLVAFAFTAVSIPLLMDHPETDGITALVASWQAVVHNWKPMLWWAVLIAFFTGLGLALFYVGLAVTMPLLGFATWHAYRDTLGEWREVEQPRTPYY